MLKSEVTEIKKRFKKDKNSFTKVMGCYVNGQDKGPICKFNKNFQSLEEEDMFKFLDIANKLLSGKIGNNLLEFEFSTESERKGVQKVLYEANHDMLKSETLVNDLYDRIIKSYSAEYNYLIVLFQDDYDVPRKGTDRRSLGESEEVFSYMLCGICPVELSKPGLGYLNDKKDIGSVPQDWIAKAPETGFMFPAFNDRSSDIHSVLFYTKNAKLPHEEFVESFLECEMRVTESGKKEFFEETIRTNLFGEDDETIENAIIDIEYNLHEYLQMNCNDDSVIEETLLTKDIIEEILDEKGYPKAALDGIKKALTEFVKDNDVSANSLETASTIKIGALRSEKKGLVEKIAELEGNTDSDKAIIKVYDRNKIKTKTVDGVECIVIPVSVSEI